MSKLNINRARANRKMTNLAKKHVETGGIQTLTLFFVLQGQCSTDCDIWELTVGYEMLRRKCILVEMLRLKHAEMLRLKHVEPGGIRTWTLSFVLPTLYQLYYSGMDCWI